MMVVLGSISPHSAWTARVMMPRGAPGNDGDGARDDQQRGESPVEALGFGQSSVQALVRRREVPEGVRARKGNDGRTNDRGVQQQHGEDRAHVVSHVTVEAACNAEGIGVGGGAAVRRAGPPRRPRRAPTRR